MKNLNSCFEQGVSALIPVYINKVGDSTLLVNHKGKERIIHRNVKTVVKRLASYYSYDIVSLHKKYGELISQKYKIPLPLHPNLILVPFKVRKPMIKDDGSYGYINLKCINRYLKFNNHSKIILNSGYEIPLLQSYYTTHRNILNAAFIAQKFIQQFYGTQDIKNSFQNNNEDMSSPATRYDIAMLKYSMGRLIQLLETILKK